MSDALICHNLSCGYQGRIVLTGVELTLGTGEILALLGPNGSGKSTLLKTIAGEIQPLAGDLEIGGKKASSYSVRERAQQIAFVPSEESSAFPFLVREIVAMGRIPHSEGLFDSDEDKRITEEAMQRAQCADLAERPVTNVSAGERQRALIARALAQQAPLLLLDEPTSHLDPGHQVSFVRLIRDLAHSGLAIVVALHDLNLAVHLADRALLFHEGKGACSGAVAEVLSHPALDAAYGTRFERIQGSDGILHLSPEFASSK